MQRIARAAVIHVQNGTSATKRKPSVQRATIGVGRADAVVAQTAWQQQRAAREADATGHGQRKRQRTRPCRTRSDNKPLL